MSAILGNTIDNQPLVIGDIERRSGLYILGKPGMGKTSLLVNLILQDMQNGHGIFFIDPHGDAIEDIIIRQSLYVLNDIAILDPENKEYAFGINLFKCRDIADISDRTSTYNRAFNVLYRLWEAKWGAVDAAYHPESYIYFY